VFWGLLRRVPVAGLRRPSPSPGAPPRGPQTRLAELQGAGGTRAARLSPAWSLQPSRRVGCPRLTRRAAHSVVQGDGSVPSGWPSSLRQAAALLHLPVTRLSTGDSGASRQQHRVPHRGTSGSKSLLFLHPSISAERKVRAGVRICR